MKTTCERFLDYVRWNTMSDENSQTVPSTPGQMDFAKYLAEELKAMGIEDVRLDEKGYIYGSIPSNVEKQVPVIGFLAHVDTSEAHPSVTKMPRVIENYDGGRITLESGMVLDPEKDESLSACSGQTLLVTDGYTLLGGDDKAGVAEIVTALEYLLHHPEVKHGKVAFSFTPDEEIGTSQDHFDVEAFGAQFAYTVDGGCFGGICYENFFAALAVVTVSGVATHPGDAKDKMKNASLIAMEFDHMLPPWERPEHTEGHDGFYHLETISGDCEHCRLQYLIRDHDRGIFTGRKENMQRAAQFLNARYGDGTVRVEITDGYRNMLEMIKPHMHVVNTACDAMRELGAEPEVIPTRGGTDGSELSYKGVPCPNLGTGTFNHHAVTEVASVEQMDKCTRLVIHILEKYAEQEI